MAKKYFGIFEDGKKKSIAYEFAISEDELTDVDILVACYYCADYAGNVFVLFEKDGKLYEVHGGHCSCYGLEGQWEPEETSAIALKYRSEKGNLGLYGAENEALKRIRQVVKSL